MNEFRENIKLKNNYPNIIFHLIYFNTVKIKRNSKNIWS